MRKILIRALMLISMISLANVAQVNSPTQAHIPDEMQQFIFRDPVTAGTVKINGLKAVLLGAPIDGDEGSWTTKEIANLKMAAQALRANGVTVYEFYTPENDWTAIKQAAAGAHFLLYRGHGVYDGSNPPKWVGGFSLKGKFASSANVKEDLRLAPNAVVMLYGCFTAGNAGFDVGKIDEREAKRRVAMYSKPFLEMGCAGYYADWFGDAFQQFIKHLFDGKTLGESYKSYNDFNSETVNYDEHPDYPSNAMWVDHDVWSGKVNYNNAFVGLPNKKVTELFSDKGSSGNNSGMSANTLPVSNPAVSNSSKPKMAYLSELEKLVVFEVNKVRRDPKAYAVYVKDLKKYLKGNLLKLPGETASLQTEEGATAIDECYEVLMNTQPLDTLGPSRGLSFAAKDHVEDQGQTEDIGHTGSDGSSPFNRIERYGKWVGTAAENIDYGNNTARKIVLALLIDDGVASRGHRLNLLSQKYGKIGVACGPHKLYRHMCVMDFAGNFVARQSTSTLRGEEDGD